MTNPMFEERTYERKQEIEVRAARGNNVNTWVKARIEQKTSKGAYVTILHSNRYVHLAFRDMRHIGAVGPTEEAASAEATPPTFNPVLSKERLEQVQKATTAKVNAPTLPLTPPEPVAQLLATVTPIRPIVEEAPDVIMENAQRLVNVSKSRMTKTRPPNALLAALLKNARELEMLSQKDVADLISMSQVMVSRFERAEVAPDDDTLLAYHEKLGMDLELLLLARDKPEEAKNYVPKPPASVTKEAPALPAIEPTKLKEAPAMSISATQKLTTPLAMDDFFEFCDKMESICPQPSDPALRKQWREFAKGMFELRSKL